MLNIKDSEAIKNCLDWFKTFIHEDDYSMKMSEISKSLSLKTSNKLPLKLEEGNLFIGKNTIAWYLFLIEQLLSKEKCKYEYYQGARILPIFITLGNSIERLKSIIGIDSKIKELWKKRHQEADSFLFEFLIALMWAKKGWLVEFLSETNKKQCDLKIEKDSKVIYVECKRQKKTSEYSYREYNFRQKIVSQVAPLLLKNNLLIEVDFMVELSEVKPLDFKDLIQKAIDKKRCEIENENCKVKISNIDIEKINNQLNSLTLKNNDPYFIELISKEAIDGFEFSYGMKGKEYKIDNCRHLEEAFNVYGVKARSLSPKAIEAKARVINSLIKGAKDQLKLKENTIIHVLIESLENKEVIIKQDEKIFEQLDIGTVDYLILHRYNSFPTINQLFVYEESFQPIKSRLTELNFDKFYFTSE